VALRNSELPTEERPPAPLTAPVPPPADGVGASADGGFWFAPPEPAKAAAPPPKATEPLQPLPPLPPMPAAPTRSDKSTPDRMPGLLTGAMRSGEVRVPPGLTGARSGEFGPPPQPPVTRGGDFGPPPQPVARSGEFGPPILTPGMRSGEQRLAPGVPLPSRVPAPPPKKAKSPKPSRRRDEPRAERRRESRKVRERERPEEQVASPPRRSSGGILAAVVLLLLGAGGWYVYSRNGTGSAAAPAQAAARAAARVAKPVGERLESVARIVAPQGPDSSSAISASTPSARPDITVPAPRRETVRRAPAPSGFTPLVDSTGEAIPSGTILPSVPATLEAAASATLGVDRAVRAIEDSAQRRVNAALPKADVKPADFKKTP